MSRSHSRPAVEAVTDPAFRASVRAETMRTAVDAARALVEECRVRLGADGLHIAAADPATVASITLDLSASAFERYEVEFEDHEGDTGTIGVDLDRLSEILRMADRDQAVDLALDAESRTLHVSIGGLDYTMGLIDPAAIRSPPDPEDLDFEFAAEAVIENVALDRAIGAADLVSNHVAIGMDDSTAEDGTVEDGTVENDTATGDDPNGTLYVEAAGDTDDVSLALSGEDLLESSPGPAHSLFSLDYLADIDRAIPSDTRLRLQLGTELPLALHCEIADGAGSVEYVLAPRMTSR